MAKFRSLAGIGMTWISAHLRGVYPLRSPFSINTEDRPSTLESATFQLIASLVQP